MIKNNMQRAKSLIPGISDIRAVHKTIQPLINHTPMLQSDSLSQAASTSDLSIRFFFKCESLQKSGSFKFRGASAFIAQQTDDQLRKGVVAVSTGQHSKIMQHDLARLTDLPLTGNFGHAVALAAKTAARSRKLTIDASVVLPRTSAPSKIAGAQRNGANVVLAGTNPQDREMAAKQILEDTGATFVGPMDDLRIVCGQGTATLELKDQVEQLGSHLDAVLLPSATGGLLAGAAMVCRESDTLVFGCEPREGGPDLRHCIINGFLSHPKNQFSVADGLRASTSRGNFEVIRRHVNGIYTATESEIKQAWRLVIEEMRLMVEPSSAVSIATVLFNQKFREMLAAQKKVWNIGIVLTGGNTTVTRIIEEFGHAQQGFDEVEIPAQAAAM